MNVAIFTDNDFGKVNGVTTTLRAVLQHAPADLRLRVYTAADIGVDEPHYLALRSAGLPIPFYGEMRMYVPRFRAYADQARRDRISVVHLTTPGPVGLAAMYVASRLQLPMVGSFHTDLAAYTRVLSGSTRLASLMREYMRWPYGKCARVFVPSAHTRELLIDAKGHADRISIWTRGVDTRLFTPSRRSAALRDSWHVCDKRPALIYVGRVSREKGLDLLPLLARELHRRHLEHRFIVVGDGPMLPQLKAEMPEAAFTGILSREAVAEAFASSDLFVFPSRTDTAGNVVLEAQASGVPVIVSADGGPRENMTNQATGLVCHTERPHEWADAIAALLRDPSRRGTFALAARDYAVSRRWDVALRPLYHAYRELADAAAPDAESTATRFAAQGVR